MARRNRHRMRVTSQAKFTQQRAAQRLAFTPPQRPSRRVVAANLSDAKSQEATKE